MMDDVIAPATAEQLVAARSRARGLPAWPGPFPATLDEAYAVQAAASALWCETRGDTLAGVKVGRILGEQAITWGADRFIGPMFAGSVQSAQPGADAVLPVIAGGSAALECEIVMVLGQDAPAGRESLDPAALRAMVAACHIGIEVAGNPVADIGALGPLASVAAFGNNMGLLLGPAIPGWESLDLDALPCEAIIDGAVVGAGSGAKLPGGVWTALAFAFQAAADRGIALRRGALISTGAVTGVHVMAAGQSGLADFGALGSLPFVVRAA